MHLPSFVTPLAGAFLLQQGQNRLDSKSDEEGFLKVSRLTDRSGVFDFAGAGDEFLVFRFTQFFEIQPLTFITGIDKIDKNSLFGGLKIPKGELCVKEISPTISRVWVGGLFSGGGGIWGSRWGAAFSAIGGGFSGDFEVRPATPVPSALDSLHFLRTEGKHPKDSPAFRGIKVIVVQGKLRELIQDISRLP